MFKVPQGLNDLAKNAPELIASLQDIARKNLQLVAIIAEEIRYSFGRGSGIIYIDNLFTSFIDPADSAITSFPQGPVDPKPELIASRVEDSRFDISRGLRGLNAVQGEVRNLSASTTAKLYFHIQGTHEAFEDNASGRRSSIYGPYYLAPGQSRKLDRFTNLVEVYTATENEQVHVQIDCK